MSSEPEEESDTSTLEVVSDAEGGRILDIDLASGGEILQLGHARSGDSSYLSIDTQDSRKLDGVVIRVEGVKNKLWLSAEGSVTVRGVKLELKVDEDRGPPTLMLTFPEDGGDWDGPLFE